MRERILLLACSNLRRRDAGRFGLPIEVENTLQIAGRFVAARSRGRSSSCRRPGAHRDSSWRASASPGSTTPSRAGCRSRRRAPCPAVGGIAVVVFGGRSGGQLQRVLLRGRRLVKHLKIDAAAGRFHLATGGFARPTSAASPGGGHQGVEVDLAGAGQAPMLPGLYRRRK